MSNYNRVIPRDLFNEANILKTIGKLCLLIEDNAIPLQYHYDGDAFNIQQNEASGALYVANINFWFTKETGLMDMGTLVFERPLNSRELWPLYLETSNNSYEVFDENGNFILDIEEIKNDDAN